MGRGALILLSQFLVELGCLLIHATLCILFKLFQSFSGFFSNIFKSFVRNFVLFFNQVLESSDTQKSLVDLSDNHQKYKYLPLLFRECFFSLRNQLLDFLILSLKLLESLILLAKFIIDLIDFYLKVLLCVVLKLFEILLR